MIKSLTFAALFIAAVLAAMAFVDHKTPTPGKITGEIKGFAVVELFTSEGCSSCPAADAVIAKAEKENEGKPVYILAYHVDYWNRLGWKDVFSNTDFSHRQSNYATWLKLSSVYTPQVIINGRREFVGSQEGTLRNAINTNLSKEGTSQLHLANVKIDGNQARFNYTAATPSGKLLVVALVKKNAVTAVKRGENGGRTLSHVQIVTQLKNIALTGNSGETSVAIPAGFASKDYELIAFVQNPKDGEILAATRSAFPTTFSAAR